MLSSSHSFFPNDGQVVPSFSVHQVPEWTPPCRNLTMIELFLTNLKVFFFGTSYKCHSKWDEGPQPNKTRHFASFPLDPKRKWHPKHAKINPTEFSSRLQLTIDLSFTGFFWPLKKKIVTWLVCAQPPPCFSFARHLVGKIVIHCKFAQH